MGWVLLAGAIAFEVFGTVMLKVSDGFSKWLPSTGVVIGYIVSFVLLAFALRTIGLSTAYAIWAGVGTVGVVLAGVLIFGEHLSAMAIVGIGTGEVATGDDAQEVCGAIRLDIEQRLGASCAQSVRILYGGSVKAANVAGIMSQPDVDGCLVGGASLDADEFIGIVRYRLHPEMLA
tara:strand:- start:1831 stop:2358 length:528 start_codon:yes stop_codon:yes gene_type:complete